MAKYTCPTDNKHDKFVVNAIEYHTWAVDNEGNFVSDLGCDDGGVSPDTLIECGDCGANVPTD